MMFKKAIILLAMGLVLVGCSLFKDKTADMRKPEEMKRYEYDANTIRYTGDDFDVSATSLNDDAMDVYFSIYKDGKYKNPFPPSLYIAFQISITNKSKKKLTFCPRMSWLYPGRDSGQSAKDIPSIYTDLHLLKVEPLDELMEDVKGVGLFHDTDIMPGEKIEGLLIFARKGLVGNAGLILDRIYVGSESKSVPFAFANIR